ncbi:hypothetical protein V8F33_013891, partial [Rhypophila sp. PSN 637]
IAALLAQRPPTNFIILLVPVPLQFVTVPVASGIGIPALSQGIRREHAVVAASKSGVLKAWKWCWWTKAAFWTCPSCWTKPLGTVRHCVYSFEDGSDGLHLFEDDVKVG